jgi:two-component system, LytTR family, sensor kinase
MLRYQLYDCNEPKIAIEKEMGYLQDYIRLQQLRKDSNYAVNWDAGDEVKNFSITPLLLIPLVENAFKHISHHSDKPNFVNLQLHKSKGFFTAEIENSKEDAVKTTEPDGGIGLSNVKRRLQLEYPGKHHLLIDEKPDTFKVSLQLTIDR